MLVVRSSVEAGGGGTGSGHTGSVVVPGGTSGTSATAAATPHAANAHLLDASVDVSHAAGVDLALHLTVQPVSHGVASHGDGPLSVVAAYAYRSCHRHLKQ